MVCGSFAFTASSAAFTPGSFARSVRVEGGWASVTPTHDNARTHRPPRLRTRVFPGNHDFGRIMRSPLRFCMVAQAALRPTIQIPVCGGPHQLSVQLFAIKPV